MNKKEKKDKDKDKDKEGKGKLFSRLSLKDSQVHLLLLLAWMAIGAGLRFQGLDSKPPWTDEFSTMVFSLGNSFRSVPLNEAIPLNVLLQPLQRSPNPTIFASIQNVIHNLLNESNHPPVYFVLANLWMQLFQTSGEYVSLWVVRSLPAILGVASIPAVFLLSQIAWRSRLTSQLAAAMMAVSPYGVYIAQEARHYTLAILLVIASLSCFVIAMRALLTRSLLSIKLSLIWVIVNSLGIAIHYFFALTLCAEGIVLMAIAIKKEGRREKGEGRREKGEGRNNLSSNSSWLRICAVAAGTLVGGLIWLPVWQSSADSRLTEWIYAGDRVGFAWLSPIAQSLGTWITLISLLPVEVSDLRIVIASGLVMLIFFIWALPILWRGLKTQLISSNNRLATLILGGFILSAIALFFSITYFFGIDLTRGPRYTFVYFPAAIALIGASLAIAWNTEVISPATLQPENDNKKSFSNQKNFNIRGKKAVALIWIMGLLSALTVVENWGYQKYYRPDLLIPIIHQTSILSQIHNPQIPKSRPKSSSTLIATIQKTHVQTGEMMGLAWELKRQYPEFDATDNPKFLLAHQESDRCETSANCATATLKTTLEKLPKPIDLWLVNFDAIAEILNSQQCFFVKIPPDASLESWPMIDGYNYQLYRCQE